MDKIKLKPKRGHESIFGPVLDSGIRSLQKIPPPPPLNPEP